jgi:hypothetical protein
VDWPGDSARLILDVGREGFPMTGELAIAADKNTGLLILHGPPTGPAGGAILTPVPGFDLLFDRVTNQLCRVTLDPHRADCATPVEIEIRRAMARLFGTGTAREIWAIMRDGTGAARKVWPRLGPVRAFSQLACFDAARATSPVPASSPVWAAEATVLAQRAGLLERAQSEASCAAAGMAHIMREAPLPSLLAPTLSVVAEQVEPANPAAAKFLREPPAGWFEGSLRAWLAEFGSPGAEQPGTCTRFSTVHAGSCQSLRWALDLTLLPAGLLLPALTPGSDLAVRHAGQGIIAVTARLAPGADTETLSRCRVRLVDPVSRRVIAQAPLAHDGITARAAIKIPPSPLNASETAEAWVEIVGDQDRPVRSHSLRRQRQALRWADTALRAGRRPYGLAPNLSDSEWAAMAVNGWEHCRRHWEYLGDRRRASQAAARALASARVIGPRPVTQFSAPGTAEGRPGKPGFLAETVGQIRAYGPVTTTTTRR